MEYASLFIKNCPIIYFDKNETYMPIDFKDILDIAQIKPINLNKVDTIYLYDKENNKVGKEIICKTNGYVEIKKETYIDLIYIINYLWYGNNSNSHAFDKSIFIVRLNKNNDIVKLGCINKNDFIWYDKNELTFEDNKPILYCSCKTHNLYTNERKNKNYLFETDYVKKDIKWEPSDFIIYYKNDLFKINNNNIDRNIGYYSYNKNIGNEYFYQQMPSSIDFDTVKMEAFYNYNGDMFNLFNFNKNSISVIFVIKILLLLFIAFLLFIDIKKYKLNTFNIISIICFIILLII